MMHLFHAHGFNEDFRSLVTALSDDYPPRFRDFLELWSNLQMDLIFANRLDPREMSEFIDELNDFLVSELDCSHHLKSRTVSLFLLLCIYVKQPARYRRRIRMTKFDLLNARQLCPTISSNESLRDVNFAWHKLLSFRCIKLVQERDIFGPSLTVKRNLANFNANYYLKGSKHLSGERSIVSEPGPSLSADLKSYVEQQLTQAHHDLVDLHESYKSIKRSLQIFENDASKPLLTLGKLISSVRTNS